MYERQNNLLSSSHIRFQSYKKDFLMAKFKILLDLGRFAQSFELKLSTFGKDLIFFEEDISKYFPIRLSCLNKPIVEEDR